MISLHLKRDRTFHPKKTGLIRWLLISSGYLKFLDDLQGSAVYFLLFVLLFLFFIYFFFPITDCPGHGKGCKLTERTCRRGWITSHVCDTRFFSLFIKWVVPIHSTRMFHGPDLSVYLTFLLHQNQYSIPLSAYRLDFVVVSDILEKNNCLVKVNYPPILHEVSDGDRITISVGP